MSSRGAILGALVLALTGTLPVLGTTPASAAGASPSPVEEANRAWREARAQLAQTESAQRTLEQRIARLKRQVAQEGQPSSELDQLLIQSVSAEKRLSARRTTESTARQRLIRAVRTRIRDIDREIRVLVPQMKAGTLARRQGAARRIRALTGERGKLRNRLRPLASRRSPRPQAWSRYEVAIEPLDGPRELNEKADFVEDTRDKLDKKRRALTELIRQARQEREVARAARDFARDVGLFDEESRSTRVTRPGAGQVESAGVGNQSDTPPDQSGNPATPTFDGRERDQPTTPPPGTVTVPLVPREISPDVLINLRVDDLADDPNVDLATLQRLEQELSELDAFLRKRANTIRSRAKKLERDEGARRR